MARLAFLLIIPAVFIPLLANAECMGPYPPSMVRSFNQNCAKEPKMQGFCSCMIDEVQKNIPLADFIEIGNSAGGINNDPRFIKAGQKCMPLVSGGTVTPSANPVVTGSPAQSGTVVSPAQNSVAGAPAQNGIVNSPVQSTSPASANSPRSAATPFQPSGR